MLPRRRVEIQLALSIPARVRLDRFSQIGVFIQNLIQGQYLLALEITDNRGHTTQTWMGKSSSPLTQPFGTDSGGVGGSTRHLYTNVPPFADNWSIAPDAELMSQLLQSLDDGQPASIDTHRLYATGLSSGGYMTSRMAISYAGKFRALAVHSASYAKCSVVCSVPELPSDHPPTLLLHGEKDIIIPLSTMRAYEQQLKDQGLTVDTEVNAEAGHEWLEAAVTRVPQWFDDHR